jgi:hydroxymethylpyrimidine kinase/phosphomethylpyrimidine kinase
LHKKSLEVVTINSLDPTGEVGLIADFRVLTNLEVKPIEVIAGIFLDQEEVIAIDSTALRKQVNLFVNSGSVAAVKTGLLVDRDNIETLATFFEDYRHAVPNLVIDSWIESTEEMPLLTSSAISLAKIRLFPEADLIIAYLSEAERLSGQPIKTVNDMKEAAEAIKVFGSKHVLIRSDVAVEDEFVDILFDGKKHQLLYDKQKPKKAIRQQRDAFASAVITQLALGNNLVSTIKSANKIIG